MNGDGTIPPYKSVVQLSQECIRRLTIGAEEKAKEEKAKQEASVKETSLDKNDTNKPKTENDLCAKKEYAECQPDDCEMIRKLKCIDQKHSVDHGITKEDFELLYNKVYSQLGIDSYQMPCSQHQLMRCYKNNPNCTIRCRAFANTFIDCIDTERIMKIKQKIELDVKEERERNEIELKKLMAKGC